MDAGKIDRASSLQNKMLTVTTPPPKDEEDALLPEHPRPDIGQKVLLIEQVRDDLLGREVLVLSPRRVSHRRQRHDGVSELRLRHQVCYDLVQGGVQLRLETQTRRCRGHHLRDDPIQMEKGRRLDLQILLAHPVRRLIVQHQTQVHAVSGKE